MKKYLPLLTRTQLFAGIRAEDISAMLDCLGASMRSYEKDEMVFRSGTFLHSVALLAEGRLLIQKTDYWGNLNILAELRPGFMVHKKNLQNVLPALLKNPHVPKFEKFRAVLFCLDPDLAYKLAEIWGHLAGQSS